MANPRRKKRKLVLPEFGTPLTALEKEKLHLLSHSLTNAKIGRRLGLTENTVKSALRKVYRRIGARDRAEAVRLSFEAGILRPCPIDECSLLKSKR
jgi:DNA-binding CsgD family transcriptional regulator